MDSALAIDAWLGRILHTTDFSPQGHLAFVHALKLALAARGELNVVHVDVDGDQTNNDWSAFPGVRETLTSWGLLPPGAPTSSVYPLTGVHVVKHEIGYRDPLDGVMSLLRRHPVDMVVLASRAFEGLERWRHPSVAEPLARKADVPALFLPIGADGFVDPTTGAVRLGKILIPIDSSPRPEAAVGLAQTLVKALGAAGAEIVMLHVGDEMLTVANTQGHRTEFKRPEEAKSVVDAIVEAAEEIKPDLIVMATQGHDGILDVLRGSTTEQVLRRAKRALLAVPAI
jgi:nucleotide-binding universal stress UspA family protein